MTRLALLGLGFTVLISTGCRTCGDRRSSNSQNDRDCTASRSAATSRAPASCDPIMTGYGQPIMQGSVVGAVPGGVYGGGERMDGELPYPQPTIPNPGVPSAPPIASIPGPGPSFGVKR